MSVKDISLYDSERKTVGAIYQDIHKNPDRYPVIVGDMSNEMKKGLIEDINDAIALKPFGDRSWYIMIHEKKDLQMKDAFLRRVLHFKYRPWPEDDTTVFWHDPKVFQTKFCWSLPHWSEMDNILANSNLFGNDLVSQVRAWKSFDMHHFGFMKDDNGNWTFNPHLPGSRNPSFP